MLEGSVLSESLVHFVLHVACASTQLPPTVEFRPWSFPNHEFVVEQASNDHSPHQHPSTRGEKKTLPPPTPEGPRRNIPFQVLEPRLEPMPFHTRSLSRRPEQRRQAVAGGHNEGDFFLAPTLAGQERCDTSTMGILARQKPDILRVVHALRREFDPLDIRLQAFHSAFLLRIFHTFSGSVPEHRSRGERTGSWETCWIEEGALGAPGKSQCHAELE